jgi:hypothetical protein
LRDFGLQMWDNLLVFKKKARWFFMRDDDELLEDGFLNGHDVWRDHEDGGIWFDGYYCADATDYEEAETEYWNTH